MTEDEEKLERAIAGSLDFRKVLIRIFPSSILKTAPPWINRNRNNFKEWMALFQNGHIEKLDEYYDLFVRWDWKHLHRYIDLANVIRDNYQITEANSANTTKCHSNEIATDSTQPSNNERNKRLCELHFDATLSWRDIATKVNEEFPGEQLDRKTAEKAVRDYCKKNGLQKKLRKSGRKPLG